MAKVLSIDPGKSKCGLVLAQINEKKVYEATVLNSELLEDYIKNLNNVEDISKIIIGNGTSCRNIKEKFNFFKKEIIIFEEKNTTFRAKARYFEFFPIRGFAFSIEESRSFGRTSALLTESTWGLAFELLRLDFNLRGRCGNETCRSGKEDGARDKTSAETSSTIPVIERVVKTTARWSTGRPLLVRSSMLLGVERAATTDSTWSLHSNALTPTGYVSSLTNRRPRVRFRNCWTCLRSLEERSPS